MTEHTGTISEAHATLQQERIKVIMAERGLNFGDACNVYIAEMRGRQEPHPTIVLADAAVWDVDVSGWATGV